MSEFKFETPAESIGLQFWKLHSKWQKKIALELSKYKITHTQFVILASIMWFQEQSIEPSQAEISSVTGIKKMTLSKAISRLENLSLVKRVKSSKDTRSVCISLTKKATELTPELLEVIESIDDEVFSTTSISDRVLFTKIISELNAQV